MIAYVLWLGLPILGSLVGQTASEELYTGLLFLGGHLNLSSTIIIHDSLFPPISTRVGRVRVGISETLGPKEAVL